MWNHNYYVYIVTNPGKTVLYTGITNDLIRRMREHYMNAGSKRTFAGKYHCHHLVWYEHFSDINHAIEREKQIKGWSRRKKEQLIAKSNPKWHFISAEE